MPIPSRRRAPALRSALTLLFIAAQQAMGAPATPARHLAPAAFAPRDTAPDTWVGTDALGRGLPLQSSVGAVRTGKYVGMFYSVWEPGDEVYDISRILAGQQAWGPRWSFHWWSQPYLGYYYRDDDYVIRKHAQMLSDAGVDAIFIDASNGVGETSKDFNRMLHVCEVYAQMRAEGRKTPQISFLTGDDPGLSGDSTNYLYANFYSHAEYADLWFQWQGKPLILANTQNVNAQALAFFNTRRSWAYSSSNNWFGDGHDRWPWMDFYPQPAGWHDSPSHAEEVSVGVGQGPLGNVGRSYHDGAEPNPQSPAQGLYFAEQWKRVAELDPDFVFVSGWNEWIAQRFIHGQDSYTGPMAGRNLNDGDSYFVDQYTEEFSRDIEPMSGGHGDDYYYQLVDGIRHFKGVRAVPAPTPARTVAINSDFTQWNGVGPDYIDDIGDASHRSRPGAAARTYTETSGRNDIAVARVTRDAANLYFYVRTTAPTTAPTANWMTLYLNTNGNGGDGWNGFEYAVNRVTRNSTTGVLQRYAGNDTWQDVADVPFVLVNNELHFSLPRATLGLGVEHGALNFDFKWADNGPTGGDPIAFLDHGDTAPNGRFSYRYQESGSTSSNPTLPLNQDVSLQVVTPGQTDQSLAQKSRLGITAVVSSASPLAKRRHATFKVVAGLADPTCYSFTALSNPKSYLRHQNFRLRLDPADASALFTQDATFCARTGLAGSGLSLESFNYPGSYLRHLDGAVWLAKSGGPNAWDTATGFTADASWNLLAPWAP